MKSIIGRFGELKKNVAGTPLSEFEDLDLNKVDTALKSVGVSLKTADGQFRDLDDVLLELSSKWDSLSRNEQRYVATIAAGSRQQSRFIALMDDYERTLELVEVAQDSAGRSSEQFAKYQDTIEMKIKRLSNTWERFRVQIANSNIFKNVIDQANNSLNQITQMDWYQIVGIGFIATTIGKRLVMDMIESMRNVSGAFAKVGQRAGYGILSGMENVVTRAVPSLFSKIFKNGNPIQAAMSAVGQKIGSVLLRYPKMSSAAYGQMVNLGLSAVDVANMAKVNSQLYEFSKLTAKGIALTDEQKAKQKQLLALYKEQEVILKEQVELQKYIEKIGYHVRPGRIGRAVDQGVERNIAQTVLSNAGQNIKSAAVSGFSVAMTTAMLEALSGADFQTAAKSAITMGAVAFLPDFVSSLMKVVWAGLKIVMGATLAGAIVAITGAIAAIATIMIVQAKKRKKAYEDELKALGNLDKTTKKLREETEATQKSAIKAEKSYEKAKENAEKYQKLISRDFLSEKNKEELNSLKDYFIELQPDMEEEINNGTANIQEILSKIEENTQKEKTYSEQKTTYNVATSRDEVDNLKKKFAGAYNSITNLQNSPYVNQIDLRNSAASALSDWYLLFPEADITNLLSSKSKKLLDKGKYEDAFDQLMLDTNNWTKLFTDFYNVYSKIYVEKIKDINNNIINMLIGSANVSNDAKKFMFQSAKDTKLKEEFETEYVNDADLKTFKRGVIPQNYKSLFDTYGIKADDLIKNKELLQFDKIESEDLKNTIDAIVGQEEWDKIIGKNGKNVRDGLEALITGLKGYSDTVQSFLDNAQYYEQMVEIINDETLTTGEIEKQLKDLIANKNLNVDLDSGETLWTDYKKNVEYLVGLGITKASSLTPKVAAKIIENLDITDVKGSKEIIAKNIAAAAEKIGGQYGLIANIPLDNLATMSVEESRNYIQTLIDAGNTAEKATEVFWEYLKNVRTKTASVITNGGQWDVIQESVDSYFETYVANMDLIQKAQDDMQKSGHVSTTNIKQMNKANIGKQFLNNVMLDTNAVSKYATEVTRPSELVKWTLESQEDYLKSLEAYDNDFISIWIDDYKNNAEEFIDNTTLSSEGLELLKSAAAAGANTLDEYKDMLRKATDEGYKYLIDVQKEELVLQAEMVERNKDNIEKLEKEILKLKKTIHNNDKSIHRLGRQIRDAEKDWLAATEGSENFRSSLDGLVNYTNQMSDLERSIERVGKALENTTEQSGSDSLITGLRDSLVNKAGLIQAERRVIESAMDNIAASLTTSFGNVFSVNENGLMNIDIGAFEKLRMSDTFKKEGGEALFNQYNQYYEQREQLIDNAEEVLKAFKDYQRQYLDAVVQAENDVASILEKQNEEEIDNLKDKYEAMEKADNEYLDALEKAIDKQRKLRELENDYDDLATKRKKLSLMQRDTSGASQKDILSLSKDIEKSEENVLDKEVDNLINELKELAETEKDTRDAELEYQEALKETVNWMLLAKDAMSKWTSVEDARAWRLSDPKFDELTAEEQEQELLKVEELYKSYINYLSSSKVEWKNNMEAIANKETEYYKNTFENVSNIGSAILQDAQEKADKEIQDTAEKLEDLRQNLSDMEEQQAESLKELAEKETELSNLRKASEEQYLSTIDIMEKTAKSTIVEVAGFALQQLASLEGVTFNDLFNSDGTLNDKSEGYKWMSDKKQINNGQLSIPGLVAASASGNLNKLWGIVDEKGRLVKLDQNSAYNGSEGGYYTDEKKATADFNKLMTSSKGTFKGFLKQFAEGGLVNFTGPAWVDGTSSKPEAFLSADDTFRIGKAAELLANLPIFNRANDSISTNIGDTSIEIHLNIDKLASDYDVERMLNKVKENIVRIAKPIGSSVILSK